MGYKLIILLGLLLGVLHSVHILVQDYQAVTAPKLLRLLFKRDISSNHRNRCRENSSQRPNVRWRKILMYDRIQCARLLYCTLGAQPPDGEITRGFILMLSLESRPEDKTSMDVFKQAYEVGRYFNNEADCRVEFPMCLFDSHLLFDLIQYLLRR